MRYRKKVLAATDTGLKRKLGGLAIKQRCKWVREMVPENKSRGMPRSLADEEQRYRK